MMMNWMILRSKRHSLQKAIGKIFSTDQSAKLVHNTNFFLNLNTHCKCRNASINSSYAHPQPQGSVGHLHTLSGISKFCKTRGQAFPNPRDTPELFTYRYF